WFTSYNEGQVSHEIKDIRSGDQVAADPAVWMPPTDDLQPAIVEIDHTGK
ncbi:MAG: histidine--tRNA ligase, partial [Yaniella sp.]|nr:histidine--tRNA ligase [Yaniella sp.]MDN6521638.1 histidine--tRNA ligase [Yaniella sp.]